jgi:very-short-patch-repair endonuclease
LVLNGAYHRYKKNIESYLIKKRLFVSRDFLESMVSSLLQYQHSLIQISQSLGTLKTALGSLACEVDNRDEISSIVKACIPFDSLIKFMADYKDCETQWSNCLNALACFMDIPKNGSIIDYQKIQSNISWGLAIQELLINHAISKDTIHEIYTNPMLPSLLAEKEIKLKSTWMDYLSATRWYQNNFDDAQDTGSENILAFLEKVRSLQTNENDFGLWASYLQEKGRLNILGLKSYLDLLEDPASKIESKDIKRIFEKTFSKMWLDDKTSSSEYPAIKQFSGRNQDSCVSYFCTLDKEQFSAATEQIATTQLTNRIDEVTTNRYNYDAQRLKNEMKSLRHETQKLRRIITTRQLFQQDFDAVINVTPCLMMSPLAVSTFITPGTRFDLVIFDEASQVPAEEAIGAIYRGKQLIVAGDEEQLPPTSFFNSQVNIASDDLAFEDEGNVADFSSILKLLNGGQLSKNNMMLQWHYRSRDESLIAFSNAKIYGNQLVTFPSPINAVSEERGVKLDFVSNGVWENQRIGNPIEAKEVAKMVMAFFEKYGDKETGLLKYSLGVVAFGITQSDAIEEALDLLMEDKPSYEKCRSQDVPEPFFIKNLETVQGDQRDFIILDVGYGRNPDGTTSMRFGPLNQLNGYKRLNVAITRAKFGITLVSSIHGSDLSIVENTERTRGLQLLHDYLVYAEPENGMAWLKQQESQGASINFNNKDGFCDIVYNFLINKGYKVVRNVGCSSYRIDFGIEDPKIGGNFYLGIECDGNTYHSAHNARERDRLRSEVLHRMGWNLFRLWSTEWVRNPKLAQDSLIQAINNAFTEYTEKQAAALAEKEKQDTLIKEKANDNQEDQQIKPAPEEDLFPEFTGTSEKDEDENANSDSSVDEDSDTSKVSTTSQATTTNGVIFTNDSFLPLNAKTEPMENSAEKETNSSEPETKQEDLSGSPIPWAPRKEFPEGVIDIIIQLSKLPITFYFQYSEVEMPRKSLLKMLGSYHFEDEYYIVACNSLFHYFKDITISRSYRISLEKKYHSEIEPLDKTRAKAAFVLYKAYSIQAEIRKFEIAENVTIIDNPSAFLVSFEKINPKTEADLSKLSGINSHFNLCLTKISYRLSELEKYTLPYGKIINTR